MSQQPSIGRVVHYQPQPDPSYGENRRTGQPWPAMITEIRESGFVRLKIFTPTDQQEDELDPRHPGMYPYSETPAPGHWSWPPRV